MRDLIDAGKRWRAIDEHATFRFGTPEHEAMYADRERLADAMAAELDDTPITETALESLGFTRVGITWRLGNVWTLRQGTMGEVRTLMRMAGIESKGEQHEQ